MFPKNLVGDMHMLISDMLTGASGKKLPSGNFIDNPGMYYSVFKIIRRVYGEEVRIICDRIGVVVVSSNNIKMHLFDESKNQGIKHLVKDGPLAIFTAQVDEAKKIEDLKFVASRRRIACEDEVYDYNGKAIPPNLRRDLGREGRERAEWLAQKQRELDEPLDRAQQYAGKYQQVDLFFKDRAQMRSYI